MGGFCDKSQNRAFRGSAFRLIPQAVRLSERASRAPTIPAALEKIKTLLKKIAIWIWI